MKTYPELLKQEAVFGAFLFVTGRQLAGKKINWTTRKYTRFWQDPQFIRFYNTATANNADTVVVDIYHLLKLPKNEDIGQLVSELAARHPRLISAIQAKFVEDLAKLPPPPRRFMDLTGGKRHSETIRTRKKVTTSVARRIGGAKTKMRAETYAQILAPHLNDIYSTKPNASYSEIARILDARGILTAQGGNWHHGTVSNLLKRARLQGIIPDKG